MERLGVEVWLDGQSLEVRAPRGALTPELRAALAARKPELIALLRDRSGAAPEPAIRATGAAEPGRATLSSGQRRLWFVEQLVPGTSLYNTQVSLAMHGRLDGDALAAAVAELVRRHDILRTTFADAGGEPRPVVAASTDADASPLTTVDLRGVAAAERERALAEHARAEALRPFDLARAPLIRLVLFAAGDEQHLLTITQHHIITDGTSIALLLRELATLYAAFARGATSPLAPPVIQYADYARWQEAQLSSERGAALEAWWKERLAGLPPLALPSDRPAPAKRTHVGASHSFRLPLDVTAALKALAQRENTTLFAALTAAWATLLQRHSGQVDFGLGTVHAGRQQAEVRELLGLFVDTLVLRCDLSGDPSFRALLGRMRDVSVDAFDRPLPFDRVVHAVEAPRGDGLNPLIQASIVLENMAMPELELPGMTWTLRTPALDASVGGTSKFDLGLILADTPSGLAGSFEYASDRFDAATIERLAGQLARLVNEIVANPDRRLSELALSSPAEERLLGEWNATAVEYAQGHRCVHELFEAQAAKTPDAIALELGDERLTYRALDERANQLAHHLQSLGVGPEVRVGICLDRSIDLVVGLFAILKAGGAYVPFDPSYPADRLAFMLDDAAVPVLVTDERLRARLPATAAQLVLLGGDHAFARQPTYAPPSRVAPDHLVYMIYTSGSTGRPKGACNAHRGVVNRLLWMQDAFALGEDDAVLQKTPFSFDVSVWEFFWPLMTGARLVVEKPEAHKDPRAIADTIVERGITTIHFVPSMLRAFLEEPGVERCTSLRRVVCSGEALPPELVALFHARLRCELHNLYGPTEAAVDVTWWACARGAATGIVPIGAPIANTRTYVLDASLQPLPPGIPGELYLGGVQVGRGYLMRPALTAERFVPDPFATQPGARLYRTGDLARWRGDGNLEFLGRIDHQVKLRGFRIELGEIESALAAIEGVRASVVVARQERLVAYVVGAATVSALRERLETTLPEYMVPSAFVMLDALPLSANGKVDRNALPAPDGAPPELVHAYVAPRTPDEQLLVNLWSEVLGVERIGIHDDFFEIGGHSLLATQVVSRVRKAFAIELPLQALFDAPTVAALAALVRSSTAGACATPPLEAQPRPAAVPLSFAQERLWFLDHLEPGSAAYNIPAALRLHGRLDVEALRRALATIVSRHEILRTTFATEDGEAVQKIQPANDGSLQAIDLDAADLRETVRREAERPVDLTTGPLFRTTLIRLADEEHVLVVTMHHAVSDGWSLGVLVKELQELYRAYATGDEPSLPELPVQYADYALWQRGWLRGELLDQQLAYWRARLHGVPALELPADRRRPTVPTHLGAKHSFVVPAALTARLKRLTRAEGATLYMTLLAAFELLLSRHSGQETFAVGTPIANRTEREVEELIGFFVNTLVLRADVAGDPTFVELLGRVRQEALGGYAHQAVPFERLVDALGVERDLSRNPLFQVMFILQNAPLGQLELAGLTLEPLLLESNTAKFDLTLSIEERGDELAGSFEYATDLFDARTVAQMAQRFEMLLAQIAEGPARPLSELASVTQSEREQLAAWNATAAAHAHDECIHDLFEAQAARTPDAIALEFEELQLSYRALDERANQLAHHLQSLGVGPEVRVGISVEPSLDMIVGLLGILKAGGAYVPLDPSYPAERLALMREDAQLALLVTRADIAAQTGARAIHPTTKPATTVSPNNVAYVIYTSGSTGRPKGVLGLHAGAVNRFHWMYERHPFAPGEVACHKTSLSFVDAVWESFGPLARGVRVRIIARSVVSDVERFVAELAAAEVTRVVLVPSLLRALVDHVPELAARLPRLMHWTSSGEALSDELAHAFRTRMPGRLLLNLYGSSEISADATAQVVEGRVSIGRPIANTRAYVLRRDGQLAGVGVPGALHIAGANLARGYLHRPALTAERFLPDPFSAEAGARMYRTGDLARWTPDGTLEYLGRDDAQVKIRGHRVELTEVEAALAALDGIDAAVVVAHEGRLVAYVVGSAVPASVRERLAATLPEYMLPSSVVTLDALPLTPNGKLDKKALPAPDGARADLAGAYVAPRTTAEELLAGVWREVLRLDRVGIHDNFFSLGGDSLLCLRVVSRARAVGITLTVQQLFQHQTIAALTHARPTAIADAAAASALQLPFALIAEADRMRLPADVVDAYPLATLQAGMLFHSQWAPASAVYHEIYSFHLAMPFDHGALEAAITALTARHALLRTSFDLAGFKEPLQLVHGAASLPLTVEDLQQLAPEQQQAHLSRWLVEERQRGFAWSQAPLARLFVHRLSDAELQLTVSFHHAILDGWSVASLLSELLDEYAARRRGAPASDTPATNAFSSFVALERETIASDEARRFWSERVTGVEVAPLPAAWWGERDATATSEPRSSELPIAQSTLTALRQVARDAGVPLRTVLLAAHLRVLAMLTGRTDVVAGVVASGRSEDGSGDRALGMYLNTLPLRQPVDVGSWRDLLRATFATERELLPFRRFPLGEIQRIAGAPPFETLFNFNDFHSYKKGLEEAGHARYLGGRFVGSTNVPLVANFSLDLEHADLRLQLTVSTPELSDEQVDRVAGYYARALAAIAADASASPLADSLLSPDEHDRLVGEWNDTAAAYPRQTRIHELFEAQAARAPHAVAVEHAGAQLSYGELDLRANRLAHELQSLGVGPEVRVGICMERSPDMIVGVLAVAKAGGAYVPLDPSYPADRLAFMLEDARVPLLLTQRQLAERLAGHDARLVFVDGAAAERDARPATAPASRATGDHLAYVIYTSGSTGKPKGAMLSHTAAVNTLLDINERFSVGPADRVLALSSLSFDLSVWDVFGVLGAGGALVIPEADKARDPAYWSALVRDHGVTIWNSVPALMQLLVDYRLDRGEPPSTVLRRVMLSGDWIPLALPDQIRRIAPGAEVTSLGGATEVSIWSVLYPVGALNPAWRSIPYGRPMRNQRMYVLHDLNPLPVGVAGDLFIGGVGVARGYLNRPSLTAERFIPDPFSGEPGARMYRTGDLSRWRASGNLEFLGRIDHQVKVRGYRIELGEIETALASFAGVTASVVVVHKDAGGDQRLVAYVVAPQTGATASALREHLKARLPEYMVPSAFVLLDALPLTSNGKVDRKALPAPEGARPELDDSYVAPRTAVEETLAAIWRELLGLERVGIHDHFFEIGGHSLLATQMTSRIRAALGVELSLRTLFESPTVSELAAAVAAAAGTPDASTAASTAASMAAPALTAGERTGALPLSFAQQRLWFLDQLEPGSAAYNLPAALRIRGQLDVEALRRAIESLTARHEVLRTTFVARNGEPVQLIHAPAAWPLAVVCLDEAELMAQVLDEAARPFDLTAGPLLRTTLLRLGAEEHVLVVTMHHIAADGWSLGVLVREVQALYRAYAEGEPASLAELTVQYADYALWQRAWLAGDTLAAQLAYWRERLLGVPALELPSDRSRPARPSHRGAIHAFVLPAAMAKPLQRLAQEHGATLYMTMLAAFQALLQRYTGQSDFAVGTPIANRTERQTEELIGFFVNTLVLRADLSADPSFVELLGRVRSEALGAYAHQSLPFERLVETLAVERDLSRSPLFQVMFVLQNAPIGELALSGLTLEPLTLATTTAKFDLTLTVEERGDEIVGSFEYATDLFDAATIERMAQHFANLVAAVVAKPERRLSELTLLGDAEAHQLLVGWNDATTTCPREPGLHDRFLAQVAKSPDAIAVEFASERLTYRALDEHANQLAHQLQSLGVGPEVRVAVCVERSKELIVGLLAVVKAGGVYVPLDPSHPAERRAFMVEDARVSHVITDAWLREHLGHGPTGAPAIRVTRDNAVYVIYTSGSTGKPKGVVVTHGGLDNYLTWAAGAYGAHAAVDSLLHSSVCVDLPVTSLWLPLVSGGKVRVVASDEALYDAVTAEPTTVLKITPAHLKLLTAQMKPSEASGLAETFVIGGEQLLTADLELWRTHAPALRLINEYGPTETVVGCSIFEYGGEPGAAVPIGRPIAHTQLYVLDHHLNPVPVGVSGELYIGGDGVARGYLHRPALTAEKFVPHPYSAQPGARMYRTGDLARRRADGNLEFLGRIDHQVKIRGYRIELGEIEAALASVEGVAAGVVLAREERLVAYVVTTRTAAELREQLRATLPEYMVPSAFVLLDALPVSASGKVDRKSLPPPDAAFTQLAGAYVAPRTADEQLLAGIWTEVLGVERIGLHDDFFEIGGHSLLATQVLSRIRAAFATELPVKALFEAPTVAELAARVRSTIAGVEVPPPLVAKERPSALPLSFAQQRLWFLDQLEPGSAAYNIPAALRMRGRLDVEALGRAIETIVARHEVLRTTFAVDGGAAVQQIQPTGGWTFASIDLDEAQLPERMRQEAERPFDLTTGPLLRTTLLRLADEEHVLLVTMHHVVSDGWSLGVLVRELEELYGAYAAGTTPSLPPLPVQYADYAVWQRGWLAGEVLDRQLAYWRERLLGVPPLELAADRRRPPVPSHRGAKHAFVVPAALTAQLKRLTRAEGATLYMTLLAAFELLMARYSGQEDFAVGTPIANRTERDVEELIGFFVNTLVMRADLGGNPSFVELLDRVRREALGGYAHQAVPFERLVDELVVERDLSRNPLFQVMFILQNAPIGELELAGLTLEPLALDAGTAKFDLTLAMEERGDELIGHFEYATDLFDAATIAAMAGRFERLLSQLAGAPAQAVSELPWATEAEAAQLAEWNATAADYPREACIHELFEAQVVRTPDAVALELDDLRMTYRDLDERANQLAHHLQSRGVGPEVRVGISVEPSLEMFIGLLAILKAGGAYVPLDPSYPADRLAFMRADARLALVLAREDIDAQLGLGPTTKPVATVCPDNAAYAIYTSGSTGKPKGVVGLHRGAVNRFHWMYERHPFAADDVCAHKTSLSFVDSVWETFGPLARGVRLRIFAKETVVDLERFVAELAAARVTRLVVVPSLLRALLDGVARLDRALPELSHWVSSGEVLPDELVAAFRARLPGRVLLNLYGSSEVSADATHHVVDGQASIGRPIANTSAYVLTRGGQPSGIGIPGELYLAGAGLARGYLDRPRLTAERFLPDPFAAEPGARMYRTGDVARWSAAGELDYLGRCDAQVKIRGHRIELGEVESALAALDGVEASVVVAHDQELVAYVVGPAAAASLRAGLAASLPEYMLPSRYVPLAALPLTPNGKVDRQALPAPRVELNRDYVAPATPDEELLAGIWRDVLGVERVGIHDNFFTLGGHSLLATQVTSRIRAAFESELPLKTLFEAPTVAALAVKVRAAAGRGRLAPPLVAQARPDALPLSFAQQRLWFLDQLEPGSAAYNIPAALRMHGPLDVEALRRAIETIVARHEVLRTTFVAEDGEPVQKIHPPAVWPLVLIDVGGSDAGAREAQLLACAQKEAARPFDLATGPLMRTTLLRLGDEEHVLLVTIHHVVADGWSFGVLVQETVALYASYIQGEPATLPELPLQYADYALWQRGWLAGEALDGQLAYWRERLAGVPALELPSDRPRPAVASRRGAAHSFVLPATVAAPLKQVAHAHGATLYMTMLAAFETLLQRYTGQTDFAVGTPIANRTERETEELIGFFVNTLVLRADLSADPSFVELLGRVRQEALGAYAHQSVPFERLVEELVTERDLGRSPLFQVMFVLQNAPLGELALSGLTLEPLALDAAMAKFDLTLTVEERGDEVLGSFEYASDLFDAATIARMARHFANLIGAVVAKPEQRLSELALLSDAEAHQLLVEWNDTATLEPRTAALQDRFRAQAARTPDAIALECEGVRLTYRALDERANQLAHQLRSLGVGPEVRVGICLERSFDLVVGMLAIVKAGGVYVPLDPSHPEERRAYLIEDARVSLLITAAWLKQHAGRGPMTAPATTAAADNAVYVIYTSGSTGKPKGVVVTHGGLDNYLTWAAGAYGGTGAIDSLLHSSVCVDLPVTSLWLPLVTGGKVRLLGATEALYEAVIAAPSTLLKLTPAHLKFLAAQMTPDEVNRVADALVIGGEQLLAGDLELWRTHAPALRLINEYGPTETVVGCSTYEYTSGGEAGSAVPIGRPIARTQLYVLDGQLNPVPAGVTGELYIGGAGVARGYLHRPALTAEKFVPHPYSAVPGARVYRTGDHARWRPDGNLEFLGRIDDQVKIRGYRIELGEVEAALSAIENVEASVVVARDERLVAYAVTTCTVAELRDALKAKLPEYMVPSAYVLLDALPLSPSGKIDKKALPAHDGARPDLGHEYVAPRSDDEQTVARIFCEVLGVERIGIHDQFFEIGGHSLLATQVISRIRKAFGVEVALKTMFEEPTVAGLAAAIDSAAGDKEFEEIRL
ncbi:MAG: tycC2 [Myxococcales bacterium]|nr:tycC2 [Myxococcales bacterium]